jgi:hypothetical protein
MIDSSPFLKLASRSVRRGPRSSHAFEDTLKSTLPHPEQTRHTILGARRIHTNATISK